MKNIFIIIIFFIIPKFESAQEPIPLTYKTSYLTEFGYNNEYKSTSILLNRYFKNFFNIDSLANYFHSNVLKKYNLSEYEMPDQAIRGEIAMSAFSDSILVLLLDISNEVDYIKSRVLLFYDKRDSTSALLELTVCLKKDTDNVFKIVPLSEITPTYHKSNFKKLDYYSFDKDRCLSKKEQKNISNSNDSLSVFFDLPVINFKIYYANSAVKLYSCVGLEQTPRSNINKLYPKLNTAFQDLLNNKIFINNCTQAKHEMAHVYMYKKIGLKTHYWFAEGMATYLGGAYYNSFEEELKSLAKDMRLHPEYNHSNVLLYSKYNTPNNTNYMYVIGALLCKLVLEKEGKPLLLDFLICKDDDESFYKAIEKHLNVNKDHLNEFLRKELEKY